MIKGFRVFETEEAELHKLINDLKSADKRQRKRNGVDVETWTSFRFRLVSFHFCSVISSLQTKVYFRLLGMIGTMRTIWHDIMPNGFCMWHDGGMTGSMTVRLSCHSQADSLLDRQSHVSHYRGHAHP